MSSSRVSLPLVALSLAALASGCNGDPAPYAPESIDRAVLAHFASCEDVVDYAQYRALEQVGPYGFEGEYGWGLEGDAAGEDGGWADGGGGDVPQDNGSDPTGGGTGTGGGEGSPDYSGTNVQELGVDEPDIVKTDGNRVLALAQGQLHYIDLQGEAPTLTQSLPVLSADSEYYWYDATQMLVHGDRVLLTVYRGGWDLPVAIREALGLSEDDYMDVVQLVEVDVSNPADMKVMGNLYVEGAYVSGRLHESTARIVISSQLHTMQFKYPWDFLSEEDVDLESEWSGWSELAYQRAEAQAEDYNRRVVRDTELDDWIPSFVLDRGGQLESGLLVDCERMMRPGTHAGLGTLSVLTIDMAQSLGLGDAVGVFTEGQTVYASAEGLYVATRPIWAQTEQADFGADEELVVSSYVHKFDISRSDATYYVASGEVPGFLLNQWAMSEHGGDLRVATTDWGWTSESESYVSVLRERGEVLELVGQVGGLGKGEQIYAVRMMGDVGYVVTFRQTDPLYTVDLSNPIDPRVVGELKINGYSAYLHPVGDGLLLGVGRDGTDDGQVLGTQISLFDVSDPAAPKVLHQASFGEWASSEVEFDHHAFLYWAPENLAVFPVQTWSYDEMTGEESYFGGALAYRIDPQQGIEQVGTIEHTQGQAQEYWYGEGIRRSLVVDDQLYTLSSEGLQRNALSDLTVTGWVEF
ncbi:MAG: beta-propeller domain-containing protein [Myxococcales bacterium]|nr:beta-propeller domain-containing protein [Myxococcales bacterium]